MMPSEQKYYPRTDWRSDILIFLVRWRSQQAGWRRETLGQLVRAEEEGADLIEQALPRVTSAGLQKLLIKHLRDERNHASRFAARYKALALGSLSGCPHRKVIFSKPVDEITLVAYLAKQERRALDILRAYVDLFAGDPETVKAIQSSLCDEEYHAAWTQRQLERWIEAGKNIEVEKAMRAAESIDQQAFRKQCWQFVKILPGLLWAGVLPPSKQLKPAPQ